MATRRLMACAAALVASLAALLPLSTTASAHPCPRTTVVLVHGAWASPANWSGVATRLHRAGYRVEVFATPLRSLSGDAAALRKHLAAIRGPIVLVGHSYGGAVITNAATGDKDVKALVYVDAFAPAQGEKVLDLPGPSSVLANPDVTQVFDLVPAGPPTATTDLYVRKDVFPTAFANDLPAAKGTVLATTQLPVTLGALSEPSAAPAWRSIPSWYEVGSLDKVIPPSVQRAEAARINAHVRVSKSGHLPMVSRPQDVTATIEAAVRSTT
jgi:pimeloyl-ACP methyl ester carboxylesterase